MCFLSMHKHDVPGQGRLKSRQQQTNKRATAPLEGSAVSALAEMMGSVHSINGSCDTSTGHPLRGPISDVRCQSRLDVVGFELRTHLFPSYNLRDTAALQRASNAPLHNQLIHSHSACYIHHTHTNTHYTLNKDANEWISLQKHEMLFMDLCGFTGRADTFVFPPNLSLPA
jgi:hypothetical protein